MNKEIIEEKAQLYALGTLPEGEVEEFEAMVRENWEVRSLVHGYQEVTELDARDERSEPSFGVYSRLMSEIDSAAPGTKSPASKAADSKGKLVSVLTWSGWAAAACVAAVFGFGLADSVERRDKESDIVLNNLSNPRLVAVQTPSEEFEMEDRMLELAGLAEAYWFSKDGIPDGQLLEDSDTQVADLSGGFTIFDRRHNIGFIAVENLPKETPNSSYHVWAKTSENARPVRAGTLPIGEESRGLFFFDLSDLPRGASVDTLSFFVTEEASESPSSPSQMVVLSDF